MSEVIFISYRRADSQSTAARLNQDLSNSFGGDTVFVDREDIPPGADFRQVLGSRIMRSKVVLVVMDNQYTTLKNANGVPRIMGENDFVNIEVSTALAFKNKKLIIPILVDGTPMPKQSELPENLHSLLFLNAFPIDTMRWDEDMKKLKKAIVTYYRAEKEKENPQIRGKKTARRNTVSSRGDKGRSEPKKKSSLPMILGIAGAFLLLVIIGIIGSGSDDSETYKSENALSAISENNMTDLSFQGLISGQLNLRDNAGTDNSNVLLEMDSGSKVEVKGARMIGDKEWYYINYNGTEGWASGNFIDEYDSNASSGQKIQQQQEFQPQQREVREPTYAELIHGSWNHEETYVNGLQVSLNQYYGIDEFYGIPIISYVIDNNSSTIEYYLNGVLGSTDPYSLRGKIMDYVNNSFQIVALDSNEMVLRANVTDDYGNVSTVVLGFIRNRG